MMAAVKAGVGRETAHHVIKEHALATVADLRGGEFTQNDLLKRLAEDERLPLDLPALQSLLSQNETNTGSASTQVQAFASAVIDQVAKYPEAAAYTPGDIL